MMNKKGFQFNTAFFSIIAISLVVISVGIIINNWNTEYGSGLTSDLSEYDKLEDVSTEAQSQKGKIAVKSSTQDENFEGTSIRGVFGLLNNIYAPFRIVFGEGGMLDSLTDRFGIPDYIRQALVTMMVMAITFRLVTIFFRLPGRSA